jgi:hypothetical protein
MSIDLLKSREISNIIKESPKPGDDPIGQAAIDYCVSISINSPYHSIYFILDYLEPVPFDLPEHHLSAFLRSQRQLQLLRSKGRGKFSFTINAGPSITHGDVISKARSPVLVAKNGLF